MSRILPLLMIILLGSCEWRPTEIDADLFSVTRSVNIVLGDTAEVVLTEPGRDFSDILSADENIVEVLDRRNTELGSRLELIGLAEGETQLAFTYLPGVDGSENRASYHLKISVSASIPASVYLGETLDLALEDVLRSEEVTDLDSVVIQLDETQGAGRVTIYEISPNGLRITLEGTEPGRIPVNLLCFDASGTLFRSLFYNVTVVIRKVVLAELFTNTGCVNCPEANEYLDTLLQRYQGTFNVVRYHVNWTDPFDPMNLYNAAEVENRRAFYNIYAAPGFVLEGTLISSLDEADWSARIYDASQTATQVYISPIRVDASLDSLFLEYDLSQYGATPDDMRVWSMVLEDGIDYLGSNGESHHNQVLRDMTFSNLASGVGTTTLQHSLLIPDDSVAVGMSTSILVFVQSVGDKQILQSRSQELD